MIACHIDSSVLCVVIVTCRLFQVLDVPGIPCVTEDEVVFRVKKGCCVASRVAQVFDFGTLGNGKCETISATSMKILSIKKVSSKV